jgi:DNA-binding CsgD family transcriptional regulator
VRGRRNGLVKNLTLKERTVLTLSIAGERDPDISEMLGTSQNNVRQLRRKGLLKLNERR